MQACWIWAWFAELVTVALFLLYRIGTNKAKELQQALHEEKYLVGRQLNNLIRAQSVPAPAIEAPQQMPSRSDDEQADLHGQRN